jgi:CRP/FNR family transcriptional regulator, anaerobic regulatory protein
MQALTKQEFLSVFTSFRKAPDDFVETIVRRGETVALKAGMRIYEANTPCRTIGFPLAGEIRVFKRSESGREITLYGVVPGEICILSISSALSGRPYPAEAVCVEQGRTLLLPAGTIVEMIDREPFLRGYICGLFADRLWSVIELIEEVTFRRLDERLADYLIEKSENNLLETTHQQIAHDLGSSREVISRLLKDFREKGLISMNRGQIRLAGLASE